MHTAADEVSSAPLHWALQGICRQVEGLEALKTNVSSLLRIISALVWDVAYNLPSGKVLSLFSCITESFLGIRLCQLVSNGWKGIGICLSISDHIDFEGLHISVLIARTLERQSKTGSPNVISQGRDPSFERKQIREIKYEM
ncbi:hypothetical protein TWF569_004250 [Orbilia oligospora]|uniref:Uncharacterized protein n=1 Tax=Orbilia oligospora TaxID=2813651 RepID=A0A7C8JNG7_ORBOL|nr:hypothetical protein TWF103_002284 [Orbilia oligospora]KAF3103318.1 hypothetical protein TWF706_004927 [Orbilia oligospora]KAF3103972.1 hypothetical protein TWF102_003355 [Orbilia oligospora]KAF3138045.1 hypothetical protein TWF594_007302 [Orbilia oligospora]KAF3151275.1 hypothetical protein TWF569_004250 [Orbilia oligospora]